MATRNYSRAGAGLAAPDPSPWFETVDVGPGTRWCKVIAYNAGGEGPASVVVSASPPSATYP